MQTWFKVTRPDWIIQDEFELVWTQHGGPWRAALFCTRIQRERTNEFYFTPEAAEMAGDLLARYDGVPCDPLDFSHRSLLGPSLVVGDQRILDGIG